MNTVCVFVASFHLSRTLMSGSFEFMRWSACVHRQDLGLYSRPGAGIAQLVVLGLAVHSVAGSILLWGHFR